MSTQNKSCDAGSFWNWIRSGSSDPGGIILEEENSRTYHRGPSVQSNGGETRATDSTENSSDNVEPSISGLGVNLPSRRSDCSFNEGSSRDEDDDPYEYDEDILRGAPHALYERGNIAEEIRQADAFDNSDGQVVSASSSNNEDVLVISDASTSSGIITPCWGCKGCNPGSPFFVLGSPADQPSTCISCQ